jgi:hypothetical protein
MIREGDPEVTLKFLSNNPKFLDLHHIKSLRSPDARSLLRYAKYLTVRAREYSITKIDFVKDEQKKKENGILRQLSVDKGLLREVESVEKQIEALINCKFTEGDINNDIVLTCFRMLVNDLLCLFQSLNEGVINILEHYFEMSKYDAQRALEIYEKFVDLTTDVVNYLRIAKHLEYATKLHVPTIKHAPIALAEKLEDYLKDPNFEVNRSQFLAEREYKKSGGVVPHIQQQQQQLPVQTQQQAQAQAQIQSQSTISNPWASQIGQISLQPLQIQYTQGLQPQHTNNPFLTQQPALQQQVLQQNPQLTQQIQQNHLQGAQTGSFGSGPVANIVPPFAGGGFSGYSVQQQPTGNPFFQQLTGNPFFQEQQQEQQQQQQESQNQSKLVASVTGNNPFSLNYKSTTLSTISEQSNLQTQPTNNPFSKTNNSTGLVSQNTGTNPFQSQAASNTMNINGHQVSATIGGYEQLPTQPVFPQTIQQQRTNQFTQQAGWELQNQIQANRLQSQFTGFQQQPQPQQTLQNQFTGFQQQQPQPQASYATYNGPSLI